MLFDFNFYSSLLLITFSQALIFSVLLLKKGIETETKSQLWLSLFVFLCCLYIAPWMLGFAGWYDNQPYRDIMFYVPFQQLFFLGPIIYFYTQSLLNPAFIFKKEQIWHLLLGIFYLLYSFTIWMTDKVILKSYYFYADGSDKDFDQWYQISGLISMVFYFALSLRYYQIYRKLMVQVVSFADSILFKWINNYLYAFLTMQLLQVFFFILSFLFPSVSGYVGSWWFFLFFSVVLYYIAITGYSNPVHTIIGFKIFSKEKLLISFVPTEENTSESQENIIDIHYENIEQTDSQEISQWKSKIETLLKTEKLYENPELTLAEVSKKLETNISIISKTVNQGFNLNFNDLINSYRIEALKSLLENGEHKKHTLLGLAYDCGFNSKATFNRAFKKYTNLSPKEYVEKNHL